MANVLLKEMGLRPSQVKAVERRAERAGKSPSEYVRWLVEKELQDRRTFAEILKPAREGFRKSGATLDELDAAVNEARSAFARRRKRRGK